jgi:hypothetical protein
VGAGASRCHRTNHIARICRASALSGVGQKQGLEAAVSMDAKKAFLITAAGFLLLSIWNNPSGTATAFADFLGNVGGFLEDAIDKFTEFFRGLTE